MPGPRPLPTAVKIARGRAGHHPINDREPEPRRKLPRCPSWLQEEARAEWRRKARELYDAGLLTVVDDSALAAYCTVFARWVEAESKVHEQGMVVETTNGNPIQNPYLAIANRAMDDMRRYLIEFGMTPASRSRVKVVSAEKEKTLAELLFAGVGADSD